MYAIYNQNGPRRGPIFVDVIYFTRPRPESSHFLQRQRPAQEAAHSDTPPLLQHQPVPSSGELVYTAEALHEQQRAPAWLKHARGLLEEERQLGSRVPAALVAKGQIRDDAID